MKRIKAALHRLTHPQSTPRHSAPQLPSLQPAPKLPEVSRPVTTAPSSILPPVLSSGQSARSPQLPQFPTPPQEVRPPEMLPEEALPILKEIAARVMNWQQALDQVLSQIQELYAEGPIVNGWLETSQREPQVDTSHLRHLEVEHLMSYVEEICNLSHEPPEELVGQGYRLCGLTEDGQMWSRPCPPEQLKTVRLAIARYHQLRQLLVSKQQLESQLSRAAGLLLEVQEQL